jgi:hypothetical protein
LSRLKTSLEQVPRRFFTDDAVAAVIHVAFKIAGIGTETSMSRSLAKLVFLAACLVAMGGWIWLLGIGIKWLVVKI